MSHDQCLRLPPRSCVCLALLVTASCGGGGSAGEDPSSVATPEVSIASPEDGATVPSTFSVAMEADGFTVEPAGTVVEGAGHLHLVVDAGCLAAGEQIPADAPHVDLADGARDAELTLPAGEHTLCLQAGDGEHAALDLTDEITVTVAGGDGDADQAEDGDASEDWEGTYEGDVVWDCGAAGRHRGTLEADVEIHTTESGRATMTAQHTVTGSCADTGSLTTGISVEGERTASGFTFPSELWGIPGSFDLRVDGDTAAGRLSGAIPGPARMTIVFDLDCTSGC